MEYRAPVVSSSSMKRTPISAAAMGRTGDQNSKRSVDRIRRKLDETSGSSRGGGGAKRVHSDMGLSIASTTSSISHLPSNFLNKKIRRCISWDIRPPKVYELKESFKEKLDDKNEVWYSKEEYITFVAEQYWTVHIMQYLRSMGSDNSELDPEKYCERGLESYQSNERRNEIDMKRKLHVIGVIHEQARQSILGTKDPEQIRLLASSQSESSLLRAQIRAALDQHEVQRALSNGGTVKTPSVEEVEAALEMHKKYLFAHAQLLEEKQIQTKGHGQPPIQPHENILVDEDTPELTIAGTVPFASLYSEKSIFNPSRGSVKKLSSSIPPICHSSPNRFKSACEDEIGLRNISFRGSERISSGVSPEMLDLNQRTQSVADFLRKARMDRQVQISGNAAMSNPSPMPLVSFGGSRSMGTATNNNPDMMLAALSLETNFDSTTISTPSSTQNTLFPTR